jgi:hypothetical protein
MMSLDAQEVDPLHGRISYRSRGQRIIAEQASASATRIPLSMGSNQSSKRWELLSVVEGESSGVVLTFFMA